MKRTTAAPPSKKGNAAAPARQYPPTVSLATPCEPDYAERVAAARARRLATPEQRLFDALTYHEAGHAVVAWCHGIRIVRARMKPPCVELEPTPWSHVVRAWHPKAGAPPFRGLPDSPAMWRHAERYVQMLLAGAAAEAILRPRRAIAAAMHGADDHRKAGVVAHLLHPQDPDAARRWLASQERRARRLLRGMWAVVQDFAGIMAGGKALRGYDAEWHIQMAHMPRAAWLPLPF